MPIKYPEKVAVATYFETEFAFKRPHFDAVGGKIYSYETMREALDCFINERNDLWRESKLDILGFHSLERMKELGLDSKKIRSNRHYFVDFIRQRIEGKESAENVQGYKNFNVIDEQLAILKQFKARDFDINLVKLIETDGITRMEYSYLCRMMGRRAYDIKNFIKYRLGYEPYSEVILNKKGKETRSRRYYLTFEECLIAIGAERFEMIRNEVEEDLRVIFGSSN
ncbi:hypothetical protein LEP3755_34000 [Leptolyngbya sp. NIES-3755]|nr:hypothetical protein LEP3755_34000 [Leptolyngbya sp. NIES-3755]